MCVAKKDVFWFRVNAFFIEKKKKPRVTDIQSNQILTYIFNFLQKKRQNIMRSVEIVKTSKTNTLVKKQTLDYSADWTQ